MKSAEIMLLTLFILTIVNGSPSVASDKMFRNDSWHSDDDGKRPKKNDHRNFTTHRVDSRRVFRVLVVGGV